MEHETEKLAKLQVDAFERELQRRTNLSFSDLAVLADQLHRNRRIANGIAVGIIVSLSLATVSGIVALLIQGVKAALKLHN